MALRSRSRSRTQHATSGPGRAPGSDGRTRQAPAEELRRRAEALFAPRTGHGALRRDDGVGETREGPPPEPEPQPTAPPTDRTGRPRERFRAALWERMPVWMQTRCGMERGSALALTVVLVVAVGFAAQHFWTGRTEPVRTPEVVRAAAPLQERATAPAPSASAGTPGAEIVVDVSGKVRRPGIHRLPAGSRVVDALSAAGGVRPGTDTDGLNRARFLVDGEQVVVGGPAPPAVPGPAGAGTAAGPSAPVSLNTATVDQLDTLPGVGPVLAQHIVDYRAQHGGFRSVDELREVNGIGERRYADLRTLVRP
ncbi:ComEA family DNA-binding protein [Streptomyces sp. NBC_00582]|uniref:ComEA family DNA-binding protein n=1 Tax=Streptomyces sp. NBC_00582 TaxID=2975783 RepID=UPI002E808A90|nr:ComEA family DNA-binding protein [Streptomyces sp. NBC_00582]WUB64815.1 ComEA family DNA-binding protein [Streptomyces sp. NBC_00582]